MNKLPEQLSHMQETQRQKTINMVLRAIADLNAEGYDIKVKDLVEVTGLSRSVFAKPHVRELLINNGIGRIQHAENKNVSSHKKSQITNLKAKLLKKDEHIARLIEENENLKKECELLRGRLFLLMQKDSMT